MMDKHHIANLEILAGRLATIVTEAEGPYSDSRLHVESLANQLESLTIAMECLQKPRLRRDRQRWAHYQ